MQSGEKNRTRHYLTRCLRQKIHLQPHFYSDGRKTVDKGRMSHWRAESCRCNLGLIYSTQLFNSPLIRREKTHTATFHSFIIAVSGSAPCDRLSSIQQWSGSFPFRLWRSEDVTSCSLTSHFLQLFPSKMFPMHSSTPTMTLVNKSVPGLPIVLHTCSLLNYLKSHFFLHCRWLPQLDPLPVYLL